MIKTLLLSTLYSALRAYLGRGVYDRLAGQVIVLMTATDMSGADKMANVLAFAQREAVTASQYLIRGAVELILYREQGQG